MLGSTFYEHYNNFGFHVCDTGTYSALFRVFGDERALSLSVLSILPTTPSLTCVLPCTTLRSYGSTIDKMVKSNVSK